MVGARARLQARRGYPQHRRQLNLCPETGTQACRRRWTPGKDTGCSYRRSKERRITQTCPPLSIARPVTPTAMQATWLTGPHHNGTLTACGMRAIAVPMRGDPPEPRAMPARADECPDLPAGHGTVKSKHRRRAARRCSPRLTGSVTRTRAVSQAPAARDLRGTAMRASAMPAGTIRALATRGRTANPRPAAATTGPATAVLTTAWLTTAGLTMTGPATAGQTSTGRATAPRPTARRGRTTNSGLLTAGPPAIPVPGLVRACQTRARSSS